MEQTIVAASIFWIIFWAIIHIITLIVFFVMAWNVFKIKQHLVPKVQNDDDPYAGIWPECEVQLSKGLLVVELSTEKQMRLGETEEDGRYKCYAGGSYVGSFAESEFMEFDKWVAEVYKKRRR